MRKIKLKRTYLLLFFMTIIIGYIAASYFISAGDENIIRNNLFGIPDRNLYRSLLELSGEDRLGVNDFESYDEIILDNKTIISLRGLEKLNLSNVERLSFNDNWIFKIDKKHLSSLTNLKILSLSSNHIYKIEDNTFSELRYLYDLDLSENGIRKIEHSAFYGAENLGILNLEKNNIKGLFISQMPKLTELKLSYGNRIKDLKDIDFASFPMLTDVGLRYNLIDSIDSDDLQHMSNVRRLYLSGNIIKSLSDKTFYRMENLTELHMDNCSLTYIPEDAFYDLKYLYVLNLNDNKLKDIPYLRNHKFLSTNSTMHSRTGFTGNYLTEEILRRNLPDRLVENEEWFQMQWQNQKSGY